MILRNTESRIPGGFSKGNAEKLGETSDFGGSNNDFLFISYLTSPLQIGSNLPFWNRYVAFVDDTPGIGNFIYEWEIVFKDSMGVELFRKTAPNNNYVFDFKDLELSNYSFLLTAVECEVSLTIPSIPPDAATLTQSIQGLATNIENYISNPPNTNTSSAFAGNSDVTRKTSNWFKSYIDDIGSRFSTNLHISENIITTIIYQNLIDDPSTLWENTELEKALNDTNSTYNFEDFTSLKIGVCAMKPHLLAMFIPTTLSPNIIDQIDDTGPQYSTLTPYREIDGTTVKEKNIFNDFYNLTQGNKASHIIDLYNQLRFPKSNIQLCAFLLNQFKQLRNDWRPLSSDEFKSKRSFILSICIDMHLGPKQGSIQTTKFGIQVKRKLFSPYILEILQAQGSPIVYEIIRIKVLDIRSGKPIKNAKVKRLEIHSKILPYASILFNSAMNNALYSRSKIDDNNSIKGAQRALHRFDYNIPANLVDGNWGGVSSGAFNSFWNDRLLDNSVSSNATTAPDDSYLQYIIDEFNLHCFTDENGVISIRIPHKFLNQSGGVQIHIGFWEFPVALERLALTPSPIPEPISRSTNSEQTTGFQINWIGDTPPPNSSPPNANEQSIDWANNINGTRHFGWEVDNGLDPLNLPLYKSSLLKTGQNLEVLFTTGPIISFDTDHFSKFYDENTYPYHFVLFGMQWCQPVWEEIPLNTIIVDGTATQVGHAIEGMILPSTGRSKFPSSFQNIPISHINKPIICTRYNTGSNYNTTNTDQKGGGRDYGIMVQGKKSSNDNHFRVLNNDLNHPKLVMNSDYTGYSFTHYDPDTAPRLQGNYVDNNKVHRGVDYYAKEGITPVFAIHGGKVNTSELNTNGLGEWIKVKFKDFGFLIAHMHLGSRNIAVNEIVMAGFKLGIAGRTSDGATKYTSGPTHAHLEISGSDWNRRLAHPPDIVEREDPNHIDNNKIFLHNDSLRLFPCDCDWPTTSNFNAANCSIRGGTSNEISKHCWASRNLHCPYFPSQANDIFLYQAQLTYLHNDESNLSRPENEQYLNPDGIIGTWTTESQSAIRRFREKHQNTIYNNSSIIDPYKNFPLPQTIAEWEETPGTKANDPTAYVLNLFAPYPISNFYRVQQ